MINFKRVLIFVAHPDDEILGCGGLLAFLASRRIPCKVVYINGGCELREDFTEEKAVLESHNALRRLSPFPGPEIDQVMYAYKTAHFEDTQQREFNELAIREIKEYQPDTVITHDSYDLHKDHRIVHEAVMVGCRFKDGSPVRNLLTFPVISSSDISPNWGFQPNVYVEITEFIDQKVKAMQEYKTEYEIMAKGRGEDAIKAWGRFFGTHSNMEYAEPYRLIRGSCF